MLLGWNHLNAAFLATHEGVYEATVAVMGARYHVDSHRIMSAMHHFSER